MCSEAMLLVISSYGRKAGGIFYLGQDLVNDGDKGPEVHEPKKEWVAGAEATGERQGALQTFALS